MAVKQFMCPALHQATWIDIGPKSCLRIHAGSYDSNQGYLYSGQVVLFTTAIVIAWRLKHFEMPIRTTHASLLSIYTALYQESKHIAVLTMNINIYDC